MSSEMNNVIPNVIAQSELVAMRDHQVPEETDRSDNVLNNRKRHSSTDGNFLAIVEQGETAQVIRETLVFPRVDYKCEFFPNSHPVPIALMPLLAPGADVKADPPIINPPAKAIQKSCIKHGGEKKNKTVSFGKIDVFYFNHTEGFTTVPCDLDISLGMESKHFLWFTESLNNPHYEEFDNTAILDYGKRVEKIKQSKLTAMERKRLLRVAENEKGEADKTTSDIGISRTKVYCNCVDRCDKRCHCVINGLGCRGAGCACRHEKSKTACFTAALRMVRNQLRRDQIAETVLRCNRALGVKSKNKNDHNNNHRIQKKLVFHKNRRHWVLPYVKKVFTHCFHKCRVKVNADDYLVYLSPYLR